MEATLTISKFAAAAPGPGKEVGNVTEGSPPPVSWVRRSNRWTAHLWAPFNLEGCAAVLLGILLWGGWTVGWVCILEQCNHCKALTLSQMIENVCQWVVCRCFETFDSRMKLAYVDDGSLRMDWWGLNAFGGSMGSLKDETRLEVDRVSSSRFEK
jgi:hypothetical protein